MRTKLVALLFSLTFLTAGLAGCTSKEDGDDGGDMPPVTDNSSTDGATDPTPEPSGNETAPPEDPAPPEPEKPADVNETLSISVQSGFGSAIGDAPQAGGSATLTVAAGNWTAFTVTASAGEDFQADAVDIIVTDAEGNEVGRGTIQGGTIGEAPGAATFDVTGSTAGDYTFTAEAHTLSGSFTVTCQVVITY